jgi:hypothetical protein
MAKSPLSNAARVAFALLLAVGLVLAGGMAYTEGEPGALPLGLVMLGAVGLVVVRLRSRGSA